MPGPKRPVAPTDATPKDQPADRKDQPDIGDVSAVHEAHAQGYYGTRPTDE